MLKFLFNHAGDVANAINNDSGTVAFDSDYDPHSIIAGGRQTQMRTESGSAAKRIIYKYATTQPMRYLVVTRADWGLTESGQKMYAYNRPSTSTLLLNPISASDLIGPYDQDYAVEAWSSGSYDGHGVEYQQVTGTERMAVNKITVSESFDLGCEPTFATTAEMLIESQRYFTPLRSDVRLRTEARIKMLWTGITKAKYDALKNWSHLYRWPFFLFDSAADVLPWKLEHVVIEDIEYVVQNNGLRDVSIIFRRLEHYE